ncbi:FGGY family carbohydrate kinase [Lacticaseibacillus sp. NRC_P2]|nr:FGGY-family carbohydrate kinase [Lacticaseibacillus casei]
MNLANLTIDVGTTNTKVSLWNDETPIRPIKQIKFETPKRETGEFINFDINKLWRRLDCALKDIVKNYTDTIRLISIASVGESGVLVDEAGHIASPMLAWYDNRSQTIIDKLTSEEKKTIYTITGLPAHAHYSASKIKWLLENVVDPQRKYTWLCIPDLLVYHLTGTMNTEFSIASRTMVFDIMHKRWSHRVKRIFGIENVEFPRPYPSGTKMAHITKKVAVNLGLSEAVMVTIAGHDHMVGSVSSGQKIGELLDSTGTTEGILMLSDKLEMRADQEKKRVAYGIYMNPNLYTVFTALPSAGSIIEWFQKANNLTGKDFLRLSDSVYKRYLAGSINFDSINFIIPHFSGSGSPIKSTVTKGLWYGLTNQTDIDDLVFGLFLGLTFELKHAVESLTTHPIKRIKVIGPGTKDPLWSQLKADLMSSGVKSIETPEAVSRGATIMADFSNNNCWCLPEVPSEQFSPRKTALVAELLRVYEMQYKALYKTKTDFELSTTR